MDRRAVRFALPSLSRRQFLCTSGAAGLAATLCLCSDATAAADLAFIDIGDGIFVRHGLQQMPSARNEGAIANIGFIVGDESVAVIDTGTTRQQGAALRAAIGKVTDRPISHLIATHVHLDHCFGHGAFADLDLRNIGHEKLPRALADRGPFYLERLRELSPAFSDTTYLPPDETVTDMLRIDLGNRPLTLTAWPAAHTDSDLTVLDERTGTLWAADLLFEGRLPTIDGSLNGWIAALDTLIGAEVKQVVPGHGAVGDGRAALAAQRDYFLDLRDGVRAALKEGLDIQDTVARLENRNSRNWLLYDDNHGRNIVTAYTELEWEQ